MIELSQDQEQAIEAISAWYHETDEQSYSLGGLAGTGKTTIASILPQALGLHSVAFCAYTGKAAQVLSRKLKLDATTIHRLIYQPYDHKCDRHPKCGGPGRCSTCEVRFGRLDELKGSPKLIICDEASMVNREIYEDLISYGVRTLWIGDHGQLPPVTAFRDGFNLMGDPDFRLEKIHRQAADSPILQLAMNVRQTGQIPTGEFGPGVHKGSGSSVVDNDEWESGEVMMLCGLNDTRIAMNKAIREQRRFPEEHPVEGDRVVCLRNNHKAGVFNGMTGTVTACEPSMRDMTYRITVALDGSDRPYIGTVAKEQFGQKKTLMGIPRSLDLWDYGYCLTVHKAQGSEADRVVLLEEPFGTAEDRRRWLYTAVTRAKTRLEIHGRGR